MAIMKHQNWWQLTAIQAGGVICLPVIIIGHMLGKNYGWQSALLAIGLGNLILFMISIVTTCASISWRKSTAEFAIEIFGESGKNLFTTAMVASMIGWFAIQTNVITESIQEFIIPSVALYIQPKTFSFVLNIVIGLTITVSSIKGLKSLTFIANITLPLLCATLGYAIFRGLQTEAMDVSVHGLNFSGTSVVIASAVAAVIDLPTFFRESKSAKDGLIAAFLIFAVIVPLLEFVGVFLFIHFQGDNIINTLTGPDPTLIFQAWIVIFLIMAGWTTNNTNLYSGGVSLEPLFPKVKEKTRLLCAGIIGTALSCFPILENLEIFLNLLGIILGSMGAVMILEFILKYFSSKIKVEEFFNFTSWAIGAFIGLMLYLLNIPFTGIAFLDGFAAASASRMGFEIIGCIINKIQRDKHHETNWTR
jgi:cytosine permease